MKINFHSDIFVIYIIEKNRITVYNIITRRDFLKQLKKYCLPNKIKLFIKYVLGYISCYVLMYVLLSSLNVVSSDTKLFNTQFLLLLCVVLLFLLLIYYRYVIKPRKNFDKRMKYFKKNNMYERVINDFKNGTQMYNNNLIVGKDCLIGKDHGLIIFYNEIESINRYLSHSNSEKCYIQITADGKKYNLCEITKNIGEWKKLTTHLNLKNNCIHIF